jgi:hypothetical protein
MINIYTFDVYIISGPISEKFVEDNQVIVRKIEIRGDQTLKDLHFAIFNAFDREEERLYEYQIGVKTLMILKLFALVHPIHSKILRNSLNPATMRQLQPLIH